MALTGSLALEMAGAEELFSLSASFQQRAGKDAAGLIRDHITYGELTLEGQVDVTETLGARRPFVVLIPEIDSYHQFHQGANFSLCKQGGVIAVLTAEPVTPDNHKASMLDFMDFSSSVMDEVAALCGQDTYWPFTRISFYAPPFRPPVGVREADDFWICAWLLEHDVRGGGG